MLGTGRLHDCIAGDEVFDKDRTTLKGDFFNAKTPI